MMVAKMATIRTFSCHNKNNSDKSVAHIILQCKLQDWLFFNSTSSAFPWRWLSASEGLLSHAKEPSQLKGSGSGLGCRVPSRRNEPQKGSLFIDHVGIHSRSVGSRCRVRVWVPEGAFATQGLTRKPPPPPPPPKKKTRAL